VKKIEWKTIDDPEDSKPEDWVDVKEIPDPNATQPEGWKEDEDGKYEVPKIANPAYSGDWKARQITDPNSPKSDFEGWCWPGTSMYPDFTNPKMREYWGSQFALDKYKGTTGDLFIWNDMNEPSVFNGPEVTLNRDVIHPHGNVEHRDVHNMYGYYVHRATFEGLEKRVPGDRPFVLTRSFFIGSHKYSAIWTGDNFAKWSHLKASIAMMSSIALGGQSLIGADVGGFFGHPDPEMMVRWYQLGALAYPFLRNHAHLETPRREPATFDEETREHLKKALQLRYKLLPLWYTIFEEYHRAGSPVVRPLFFDFLGDEVTHSHETATEDQIMLGDVVLVHGVTKPLAEYANATGEVYLPSGPSHEGWYSMNDDAFYKPGHHSVALALDHIPAFYRAGTIVPMKTRARRSSACMTLDPLTLSVYLDPSTGTAKGRVYVDDYKTKDYQDGKSFLNVEFEYRDSVLKPTAVTGNLPADVAAEIERVEVFGLDRSPKGAEVFDGTATHTQEFGGRSVRQVGSLYATTVKVSPWIKLSSKDWSVKILADPQVTV